ncbi:hypothetical protein ES319_D05G334400v1 [Gossypium barbadense]|uniref:Uncharacterized protein n=1 Tax=Gossypium barbadense TaxID=3634 RepID=A0A5J5RKC6_GOSBA|nr:hypothetical protein ES319_D05G334400v1 [Gossypium barbadense]
MYLSATSAAVLSRMLINTFCHVFTLDWTFPWTPTFSSTNSSAVTPTTSSGSAPSITHIRHEQKPLLISESLSARNQTFPFLSIPASSHTWAVQPLTRFSGSRADSSNGASISA